MRSVGPAGWTVHGYFGRGAKTFGNPLGALSGNGAVAQPIVDIFLAPGTWTKRPGATRVDAVAIGDGGGGGAGAIRNGSGIGAGQGGGGGARVAAFSIPAALLTHTVAVTVGPGGAGAPTTATTTAGAGTGSSFGAYLVAGGGTGGESQDNSGPNPPGGIATATIAGATLENGGEGGLQAPGLAGSTNLAPSGGGGGGAIQSVSPNDIPGANGGTIAGTGTPGGVGGFSSLGGFASGAGGPGVSTAAAGSGGGGSGMVETISPGDVVVGNAGAGGLYGGGGGGGGPGLVAPGSTGTGGAGGNGSPGIVIVTTYF